MAKIQQKEAKMTQNDLEFIASALSQKGNGLLQEIIANDAFRRTAEEKAKKESTKTKKEKSE